MTHTISFRRPELFYVLSKMTVPPGSDVRVHIQQLEKLGYTIVDVSPPLSHNEPQQMPLLATTQRASSDLRAR